MIQHHIPCQAVYETKMKNYLLFLVLFQKRQFSQMVYKPPGGLKFVKTGREINFFF